MNRAERRRMNAIERKAAKQRRKHGTPLDADGLTYAGFWYNADQQENGKGWEWIWCRPGLFEFHPHAAEMNDVEGMVKHLYTGAQGWLDEMARDGKSRQEVCDIARDEVENVLDHFRNYSSTTFRAKDEVDALTSFCFNVLILDTFGAIPDDEYNGTKFGWINVNHRPDFALRWHGV